MQHNTARLQQCPTAQPAALYAYWMQAQCCLVMTAVHYQTQVAAHLTDGTELAFAEGAIAIQVPGGEGSQHTLSTL